MRHRKDVDTIDCELRDERGVDQAKSGRREGTRLPSIITSSWAVGAAMLWIWCLALR